MDDTTLPIIITVTGQVISGGVGYLVGRRKATAQTDSILIKNLADTIKIYDATYKQQVAFHKEKYEQRQIELEEENKVLKIRITILEEKRYGT